MPQLLLIYFIKQILFILFFFFLTIFYLDDFKFSNNKLIKYSEIFFFILFVFYIILLTIYILLNYDLLNDIIFHIKADDIKNTLDKNDITLKGKIVLDKEAGAEIAKGLFSVGSNVGLAACVGALTAGASKTLLKSSLPPVQKIALLGASGVLGGAIHTGASAINAQTHMANNTNVKAKQLPNNVNSLLEYGDNTSPLEILLKSISVIDTISIWLFVIIFIQFFFIIYITDKPRLKLIDYFFPSNSNNIRGYIYKLIKIYKNMSKIYIIIAPILLFISILASTYFAFELHNNIASYVDVYIQSKK